MTCLAVESQWPQLVSMLREGGQQLNVSDALSVALQGFLLQGIFFRLIVDEEDWKAIRMELRVARRRGVLLLAMEATLLLGVETRQGLGVRLLASPLVPWDQP